jgi:hypothetical protein
MILEMDFNDELYQRLPENELEVIIRLYNPVIKRVRKHDHLGIVEFYYEDKPSKVFDIRRLDDLVIEMKQNYRNMRLAFLLK